MLVAVIAGSTVDAVHFNCGRFMYLDRYFVELITQYICMPGVTMGTSTALESVIGDHWTEYLSNDDVEGLIIANQNMPFVPQGIDSFFKNLKALEYSSTLLLSLSAEDLRPLPQLEFIVLYRTYLTSFNGDLFLYNPLLKSIDLSWNGIQHIGENFVTNLDYLERLDFYGNYCVDTGARNRTAVMELASQLSDLCPPLDATTIATTEQQSF